MMEKIQKFGGAMFTPVLLFAFAGVIIGFGTLFTTEVIMGPLAYHSATDPSDCTLWYGIWNMLLQGRLDGLQPTASAFRRCVAYRSC